MSTPGQEHKKVEQLEHASPDEIEVMAGRDRENLEGWIPAMASDVEIREALEKAFDYRGDITITLKNGTSVEGYAYDRRMGKGLNDSMVRVIPTPPKGSPAGAAIQRVSIPYSDVAALTFSGRDAAAGRSFEAWVKRYWEKKAAGEKNIAIEPEKLD